MPLLRGGREGGKVTHRRKSKGIAKHPWSKWSGRWKWKLLLSIHPFPKRITPFLHSILTAPISNSPSSTLTIISSSSSQSGQIHQSRYSILPAIDCYCCKRAVSFVESQSYALGVSPARRLELYVYVQNSDFLYSSFRLIHNSTRQLQPLRAALPVLLCGIHQSSLQICSCHTHSLATIIPHRSTSTLGSAHCKVPDARLGFTPLPSS